MEITKYKRVEGNGPVMANLSIYIPSWGLTLNDCRLIRTKKGATFIGFPAKKFEIDGEAKFAPYFKFDTEIGARFQKSAHIAIDKYVKKHAQAQVEKPMHAPEDNGEYLF